MPMEEISSTAELARVGVFLCACGGQISTTLDIHELARRAAGMPGVVYTACEDYPCSPGGRERLLAAIRENKLERVALAGCAPRLVEKLFGAVMHQAGRPADALAVVDIREAAAWMHAGDPQGGLRKAAAAIEMGIAHLQLAQTVPVRSGPMTRAALVLGSELGALTVALALAEQQVPVTLVESGETVGVSLPGAPPELRQLTQERGRAVLAHPGIQVMQHTHLRLLGGHPGCYQAWLEQRGQTSVLNVGVVVAANRGTLKELGSLRWLDRSRIKSQTEFEQELEGGKAGDTPDFHDVVFYLCAEESQRIHCSRMCCGYGFRQAIRIKELYPQANVTILFRELYLGERGEAELARARQLGVTFFRYRHAAPPVIGDNAVDVQDLLTGVPVQIPYDRVVMSMPLVPAADTAHLAALLDLPLDEWGFLAEGRLRLRPGRYADPGVYVLGSARLPAGATEALFQAYLAAARALRLLDREEIRVDAPVALIDAQLCTGCGNCPQVCPVDAIHLERRDGILSLSEVDGLRCIGCGNCVVVCPVKAITLPGWENAQIPAQISAALDAARFAPGEPRILVLACEWSAYAAAEAAGRRHIAVPACARLLRMNCSARFDPYHILWAFLNGADGVLLGACPAGECHYGMGNLYAQERVEILQGELASHHIDPHRLRLEAFRVDDGEKFAQVIDRFVRDLRVHRLNGEAVPSGTLREAPVTAR